MTTIEVLIVVMLLLVFTPYVVYVSVKLGTYAFFRGRQLFEKENSDGETARRTKTGECSSQG